MTGERFQIELRSEPSDVPATTRLRAALKVLLRSFRLRCVSITHVAQDGTGAVSSGPDDTNVATDPGSPAETA